MIRFQDVNYETREIELPKFGNVLISTIKLNEKLLNENGSYVSENALKIDEEIFYFVEEDEINLSDFQLEEILLKEII